MKIAYMGFDLFAVALETLLQSDCEIIKIFTCKVDHESEFNEKVIAMADEKRIPWTDKPVEKEDLAELKEAGCEAVISAGYYYRIPVDEELFMVNIHPSLLPEGRGAWPMPIMILNGYRTGGVTIHKLKAGFDTGDILMTREFPMDSRENLEKMTERICSVIPEMICSLLENFKALYDGAVSQGEGTYWLCPSEKDWVITPAMDAEEADRILRAFYGFECLYRTADHTYRLVRGRIVKNNSEGFPVRGGFIEAEAVKEL